MKGGYVFYNVIGRHHQHQRLRSRLAECERRERQGWGGIAPDRLQQYCRGPTLNLSQLLGNEKPMLVIADNPWIGHVGHAVKTLDGLLKQRLLTDEAQQLLRIMLTRKGPEALTCAAGEDDGTSWFPVL